MVGWLYILHATGVLTTVTITGKPPEYAKAFLSYLLKAIASWGLRCKKVNEAKALGDGSFLEKA